jgi:uncharacterized protein YodC (DUF2158 family)
MTDEFRLQIGDIVRLVSGGPKMTVVALKDDETTDRHQATCAWFPLSQVSSHDGTQIWDDLRKKDFDIQSLEVIDDEEEGDLNR